MFRVPHGVFLRMHQGTWHAGGRWAGEGGLGMGWVDREGRVEGCGRAAPPTAPPCPVLDRPTIHPRPAGPLFDGERMSFYNLELADTNVVDHNTHDYGAGGEGLEFEIVD